MESDDATAAGMSPNGGLRTRGLVTKQTRPGKPLVSVVTVVRNGQAHLEDAIRSVLRQDYENIEYIIIDGGSTDGTLDIIRKYEDRIAYWVSEKDRGIYDAMNKGIGLAAGELIGLLNSDDYYEDHAITSVVERYLNHSGTKHVIVYGNYFIRNEELDITTEQISDLRYWRGMTICHQAMFVHRSLYSDLFKYDLQYRLSADYDFFIKAIKSGTVFLNTGRFLVSFKTVGETYKSVFPMYRETGRIIHRHFGYVSREFLFLMLRVIRISAQSAVKRIIGALFGKKMLKKVKIIQNRLANKVWHDVRH